jgi:uncharacterized protein
MQAILPASLRAQRRLSASQGARRVGWPAIVFAFAILLAINSRAAEVIPPKPDRYFNDYAGVVSREVAHRFNEQLAQFERETSNQFLVVVYQHMQSDSDIADYVRRFVSAWNIGQKGRRNGVVLAVFVDDHKLTIQTNYGLEGALPDATCFDIINNVIRPKFKAGDYEGGLQAGINAIIAASHGEYKGSGKTVAEGRRRGSGASGLWPFLIFVIVLIGISRMMRRLGGYGYSSGRSGPVFLPMGGGGGWSSGGGGGFSGFSGGGGGSFGGGGASGSW